MAGKSLGNPMENPSPFDLKVVTWGNPSCGGEMDGVAKQLGALVFQEVLEETQGWFIFC